MKRFPVAIFLTAFIFSLPAPATWAADQCSIKVCVKVFTDPSTGEVVITAKKNGHKPTPRPKPTRIYVPKPKPATPRPKPTRTYKPRPKVVRKKNVPGPSLADRLTQLIPTRAIHIQPTGDVLVQVPANFWTDTSDKFQAQVLILGVPVSVHLTPTFEWDFGDQTPTLVTTLRGAPYPSNQITHTYHRAGHYEASLRVSWAGTWSSDGATFPVLGNNIVQVMSVLVVVGQGPTKFTK